MSVEYVVSIVRGDDVESFTVKARESGLSNWITGLFCCRNVSADLVHVLELRSR